MTQVSGAQIRESYQRVSDGVSTYGEEADRLGISRRTLHRRARAAGFPPIKTPTSHWDRLSREVLDAREVVGAAWFQNGETLAEAIARKVSFLESQIHQEAAQ